MSKNGQTHFKNIGGNTARFLKCVWPFWDILEYANITLLFLKGDPADKCLRKKYLRKLFITKSTQTWNQNSLNPWWEIAFLRITET